MRVQQVPNSPYFIHYDDEGFSLRYTLYDGGYNFATLLYAVYSDVNGWTVQMEKE